MLASNAPILSCGEASEPFGDWLAWFRDVSSVSDTSLFWNAFAQVARKPKLAWVLSWDLGRTEVRWPSSWA